MERRDICSETVKQPRRRETSKARHSQPKRLWAVLSQIQEGKERVIAYYSKTLAPPERNYCVTHRELLAVVKAMKHFRPYLYGTKFKLRTDHASLRWLCRRHEPSAQVARWLEIMSAFSYELEHRAGKRHSNADGLSRQTPSLDCKQCAAIEQRDGGPSRAEVAGRNYKQLIKWSRYRRYTL